MPPTPETPFPRPWGRYTLTELLGKGGMGAVYGAKLQGRGGFEKAVALKVLHAGNTAEHLLEEARLGGYLHHPYVVETYDVGVHEDQVFFAMEWVRGPTIHDVLKARAERVPIGTCLDVVQQLCLGLDYAHTLALRGTPLGLVHLDIKPQNVLLDPVGMAKITDFGIARAAGFRTHDVDAPGGIGTRGYMAPEMVQSAPVDARSDVFAVATMGAELILGRKLWPRKGGWIAYGRAVIHARDWLRDQRIPQELDQAVDGLGAVLLAALDERPDERTQSLHALHGALGALHPGGGSIAELVAEHHGAQPRPAIRPPSSTTGSAVRRTNLARSVGELVGREADLERVLTAIAEPGIVTLKGPGGVGKTRLSQATGRAVLPQLEGGVWFVDLASCTAAEEAIQAIRQVIEVPISGEGPMARAEALAKGIAGRGRMVVILDNVEQLVEELAPLLRSWPALAPQATFLLTSQRQLGTPGERVVALGALDIEAGAALFLKRADLPSLTSADVHVRAIVERLDGLPLAIELAASRARVLPPEQILAALDDRFRVLVDRSGARPSRHQTLHNAVDWSWQLLTGWQQAALA